MTINKHKLWNHPAIHYCCSMVVLASVNLGKVITAATEWSLLVFGLLLYVLVTFTTKVDRMKSLIHQL